MIVDSAVYIDGRRADDTMGARLSEAESAEQSRFASIRPSHVDSVRTR